MPDDNHTDPPYHTRVVVPAHRKQTKKRKKKSRHRKRKLKVKNKKIALQNKLHDNSNLIVEGRKNRDAKTVCSDCKIRKRKGRKLFKGKISPQLLRKILEKVADDTLSGARAGDGTISSILENEHVSYNRPERKQKGNGWSYDQHWYNGANGNAIVSEDSGFHVGKLTSPHLEQ